MRYILALDQGTTSSRAMVFDETGAPRSVAQQEIHQHYPQPGWVEHDPEEIWETQLATARSALAQAGISASQVAAIGITNQRETTIVWDRRTGRPVQRAIVWQDRRTAPLCERLRAEGLEQHLRRKTGLVLDPYFSATKLSWLLDQPGLRARAERGELAFGTVDCWLIHKLTLGRVHATDASNASRTLLFDIHEMGWDDDLLKKFGVPRSLLPQVRPSQGSFGHADASLLGAQVPIAGVAGDQQAALFGQACFRPGLAKNTYGTGCFLVMNTGQRAVITEGQLLTTVAWQTPTEVAYALEGPIFVAGAAVQWLRDELGIITSAAEVEHLAARIADNEGVYFVPALVGLGAPYWDPAARGTIVGLTRGSGRAHLARAALEAIAYQTRDVVERMRLDSGMAIDELSVDGGASVNNLLMQFQSDILGIPVARTGLAETTALGAAYLAGLQVGVWESQAQIAQSRRLGERYVPSMTEEKRAKLYAGWLRAVERAKKWE